MEWTVLNTDERLRLEVERLCRWHKHFAWRPVVVSDDGVHVRKAWLQFVGRKGKVVDRYSSVPMPGVGPIGWMLGGWKYCLVHDMLEEALKDNEMITTSPAGYHPKGFTLQKKPPGNE